MTTVACVLRSGGDYGPEYVERLRDAVAEHAPGAHFVCLSDVGVPCERIPLLHGWPGWWSKLEVFRLRGPVLYLDLDTVITGPLDDLLDPPGDFVMLEDFTVPGDGASGVMFWRGDRVDLYYSFLDDPEGHMARCTRRPLWGDGGFIADQAGDDVTFWQTQLPGQIVSRKVHRDRRSARVVCYHGQPRPHETGWAA